MAKAFPYEGPEWAGPANATGEPYTFYVIKEGVPQDCISLLPKETDSTFVTLGRIPLCDIVLAHESISRFHMLFQFDKAGKLHAYDLKSVHGTFLNKKKLEPYVYTLVQPGDCLKFGASRRLYFLQGNERLYGKLEAQENEEEQEEKIQVGKIVDSKPSKAVRKTLASFLESYDLRLCIDTNFVEGTHWQASLHLPPTHGLNSHLTGEPLQFSQIVGQGETKKDAEWLLCANILAFLESEGLYVDEEAQEIKSKKIRQFFQDEQAALEQDTAFFDTIHIDSFTMPKSDSKKAALKSTEEVAFMRFELMDLTGEEISSDLTMLEEFIERVASHYNAEIKNKLSAYQTALKEIRDSKTDPSPVREEKAIATLSASDDPPIEEVTTDDFRVKIPKIQKRRTRQEHANGDVLLAVENE
jgi:pSer/pThr/pTyr-binding forkhead associated (FHA) protein